MVVSSTGLPGEHPTATTSLEDVGLSIRRLTPERIMLDLRLPIHNGVELLQAVVDACPEALILTTVRGRSLAPTVFWVRLEPVGLSLHPVDPALVQE